MTDLRASKAAGRKLLRIMLSVFVPIAVLAYMLFSAWKHDISVSSEELKGLEMAGHVFPVLLANASSDPRAKEDIAEVLSMHADHHFDPAIMQELMKIDVSNLADDTKVGAFKEVIGKIGVNSGLLLDRESEPFFLILAMFQYLPAIAQDYHEQQVALARAITDNSVTPKEVMGLTLLTGNLLELMEGLEESVATAQRFAMDQSGYTELRNGVALQSSKILAFEALIHDSTELEQNEAYQHFYRTNLLSDDFLDHVNRNWNDAADKVQKLIQTRITQLVWRAIALSIFGALSCLLGLGLAFSMFRTNLKELDEVAGARHLAETARIEAERLASDVSRANQTTEKLNHELAGSLKNLKWAQDSIIKKGRMEQLGLLTETVAHELRNPLSTVANTTFLLEKKLLKINPDLEPQFQRISKSVSRCDAIISQLLEYSRSRQITSSMNNLDDWLLELVEKQALVLPQAVRFECSFGLEQTRVWFDPAQLERALINLIANASEALVGKGKDPLKLAAGDPLVSISTAQKGEEIEISISDNGPGIQPILLEKIREPLFTTKSFGAGLGIPIAEQIVTQHGGKLFIHSKLGEGTRFTIRIPAQQRSVQAA
jgi:signal transduction histidine kinase